MYGDTVLRSRDLAVVLRQGVSGDDGVAQSPPRTPSKPWSLTVLKGAQTLNVELDSDHAMQWDATDGMWKTDVMNLGSTRFMYIIQSPILSAIVQNADSAPELHPTKMALTFNGEPIGCAKMLAEVFDGEVDGLYGLYQIADGNHWGLATDQRGVLGVQLQVKPQPHTQPILAQGTRVIFTYSKI